MNKEDLINQIAEKMGITKRQAINFLDVMIDILKESLLEEKKIMLRGLGTFQIIELRERRGRNPRTGEEVIIPGRKRIKFKASSELLRKL